jgi:hypothetical protein
MGTQTHCRKSQKVKIAKSATIAPTRLVDGSITREYRQELF